MFNLGGSMNNVKEQLGLRIQELRKNKGLNQAELSEMISVDAKHISRLETGVTFPSPATLEAIAKALDVQIKELFEFEHIAECGENIRNIEMLLKGAGDDKLQMIYKVVRAILK
jgi:transcriptional regulator with XRE-family HTH domain